MKNIKKLCIPLFSLVLVLGCFAVSQMDASAYTSAYACPGHRVYLNLSHCVTAPIGEASNGVYLYGHEHTYRCPVAGCNMMFLVTETLVANQPCVSNPDGPSHTHNYSTAWGEWRKISSCRLPG